MSHTCSTLVVHCIDFRFQKYLNDWLQTQVGIGEYDRVSYAGGVFALDAILTQIEISHRLHRIKKLILVNHEDCGAYGQDGTKERHTSDLNSAKNKIKLLYPDLIIDAYYLHLDGTFETINS